MEARPPIDELIHRYLDEGASPEELAALGRRLEEDPVAAAQFVAAARFDALLAHYLCDRRNTDELLDVLRQFDYDMGDPHSLLDAAKAGERSGLPAEAPGQRDPSPVLGFLGGLPGSLTQGGGLLLSPWSMAGLLAALLGLAATVVALVVVAVHRPDGGVADRGQPPAESSERMAEPTVPRPVARLSRVAGCRWNDSCNLLEPGARLSVGQSLHLAEGVAEIDFDIGAKIVLQGPAAFVVDSPDGGRLEAGKLTAEIRTPAARGFRIVTPAMTFIDKGTEFGVEVAPGGGAKVHVFKGEVEVDLKPVKGGPPCPPQRLFENRGARMEAGAETLTLVQDTGECFIRSVDDVQRDRHVVAYWRFEDHPVGTPVPDTAWYVAAVNRTMRAALWSGASAISAMTVLQFGLEISP